MFGLKYFRLVQTLCNSDEIVAIGSDMYILIGIATIGLEYAYKIVAIGSDYSHFSWNSCNWLRICAFHLNELQLPHLLRSFFEIVVICSDSVRISRNSCSWCRLCAITYNVCN